MFDPAPVVERSADAASLPASQLLSPDRAVHVIIVQYIDEKVVLQRMTEYKSAIAHAAGAFSPLAGRSHDRLYFEGLVEGSVRCARIDERLWPLIVHTLSEVTIRVLSSTSALALARRRVRADAEARLKLITEIATSPIVIIAAGDEYHLDINLVSATVLELKRVIERKFGLPVAQQQLYMQLPTKETWRADDNDILASVGVIRGSRLPLGIKRASW